MPEKIACPVCFGTGHQWDECMACKGSGRLPATHETVTLLFNEATLMMQNIEYQGPSEHLIEKLGWGSGDYDLTPSPNARRILVNAEATIVYAVAVGLADMLKREES